MADEQPKKPHSFITFLGVSVREGWTESREKFGLAVDITLALAAFAIVGFAWYSRRHIGFNEQGWESKMNYWLAIIPVGLWVAWFIYHVLKAAHNLYVKEFEKNEEERKLRNNERAVLQSEIKDLTEKLAGKSEADKLVLAKQAAKDLIGGKIMLLDNRLIEARNLSMYEFVNEVKANEWETTQKIFNDVERILLVNLTLAELGRFRAAHGASVKEITDDPYFAERRMDKAWHYNCILAKRDVLIEIVKELG